MKTHKTGYLRGVINALPTQDRLLNRKCVQQLRVVVHRYGVRLQFLRSQFDPHSGWCFFFTHYCLRQTEGGNEVKDERKATERKTKTKVAR